MKRIMMSAAALVAFSGCADDTVSAPAKGPLVVINEVVADGTDWVELYNAGDEAQPLAGWRLTDSDPEHIYLFADDGSLAPGAFLVIERGDAGFDFGLGKADSVILYAGEIEADSIAWDETTLSEGYALGRVPDGTGTFAALNTPTPGATNQPLAAPTCGDNVISAPEICDGSAATGANCRRLGMGLEATSVACSADCLSLDVTGCPAPSSELRINELTSGGEDQIELFNAGSVTVDLGGWHLADCGDGDYTIAPGTSLDSGQRLVFTKAVHHTFGLSGSDCVRLSDADGVEIDFTQWGPRQAAVDWCRQPDGSGAFTSCSTPTFGAAND